MAFLGLQYMYIHTYSYLVPIYTNKRVKAFVGKGRLVKLNPHVFQQTCVYMDTCLSYKTDKWACTCIRGVCMFKQ